MSPRATLLVLLAASVPGGCVSRKNDGLGLGGVLVPEAVAPPGPGIALSSDQPSVTSFSRDDWERTEFLVPVLGVAHKPMYTKSASRVKVTPRQRGEFPTTESAMDLVAGSAKRQRREAFWAPFRALGSAILLVPKMFYQRPWQSQWSPRTGYQRFWGPATETP